MNKSKKSQLIKGLKSLKGSLNEEDHKNFRKLRNKDIKRENKYLNDVSSNLE